MKRVLAIVAGGVALLSAVCVLCAPRLHAQCSTGYLFTGSLQFGQCLDVGGDSIIVGDYSVGFGGSAAIVHRDTYTWKLETWMHSPTPEPSGRFGDAVSVSGDWAAVGAPGELGNAGAVHLFQRQCEPGSDCEWIWVARLLPAAAAANDRFGASVALDGSRLLVGAPGADLAALDAGAVFVFEASGGLWTQVQVLTTGAGAMSNDGVGSCVALAGDLAVVGSKASNVAWLFERGGAGGGPVFGAALPLEVLGSGNLGASVATDGTRVLLGSPGSNITAIKSGAAHLFERDDASGGSGGAGGGGPGAGGEWTMTETFTPTGPSVFASFGSSVALDGGTASIGASGMNAGNGALSLLHLEEEGWSVTTVFHELPGPASKGLGVCVALDGDTLVGGARIALGPPGIVFIFGGVGTWDELGGGISGSFGVPRLDVQGSLCGGGTLSFEVSHGKPKAPALFVVGLAAAPQPWKGGVLWPRPDLVLPKLLSTAGKATLTLHIPTGQPSGVVVFAQAWIADLGAVQDLSATSAISGATP